MATKEGDKKGLLGWIRSSKQAEDPQRASQGRSTSADASASQPPASTSGAAPAEKLQKEVAVRYADKGEIARGGMGSIRKVFDANLQRTVAMKVLFPEHRADAKLMARFAEEAQILGQLEHPNIVPVHDFGEDHEGTRYFTMYYVKGKTLTEMLHSETVADGSREAYFKLLNVFVRVCDAVAFAHSRGVIHRDLKPDNIMVGAFGEVYLMDWGIARLLGHTTGPQAVEQERAELVRVNRTAGVGTEEKGQIIGTFFYMSPEQAKAEIDKIDERTDVFLLGGVLYEILTGQPPYVGTTAVEVVRAAQRATIPPPELLAPERNIPAPLSRIVMKCLQANSADRYQNALLLKADVENFLKGGASFPTVSFQAGEMLMNEGEKGEKIFIINKGLVQVYKTFSDGRRQGLATLGPGSVVGEAAVFSAGERTASVVAVEDTVVTTVTSAQLDRELGLNQWMGPLVKALAERFIELNATLNDAQTGLNAARIENWIFQYILTHGHPGANGEKEVVLSAMLKQAKFYLKKPEAEVRRVVDAAAKLKVDAERDVVAFVP